MKKSYISPCVESIATCNEPILAALSNQNTTGAANDINGTNGAGRGSDSEEENPNDMAKGFTAVGGWSDWD